MTENFLLADEPRLFDRLEAQASDSLLALIGLAKADTRPEKIDVGVGVYRDAAGATPILRAVKAAEKVLIETQETKSYLGSEGDARFVELIKPIVFDEMIEALKGARAGDLVLVHGCCHNPTGADLSLNQWRELADLIAERGLIPYVDLAYQGLGNGLEDDAAGTRLVVEAAEQALVAQSCDKNFGLYRERTGALFIKASSAEQAQVAFGNLLGLARTMWSMPPDHGAAIVRTILETEELEADWRAELKEMLTRIRSLRARLAAYDERLAFIDEQNGMFSMLPLTPEAVVELRASHGIYMANSGRFNVAGLSDDNVDYFAAAVVAKLDG